MMKNRRSLGADHERSITKRECWDKPSHAELLEKDEKTQNNPIKSIVNTAK
jgi:hypothetical protein